MKINILHISRNDYVGIFGGSSSAYYKFFSVIYSMVSQKCPNVKESNYVFLNKYHMMSFMNLYKSEQWILFAHLNNILLTYIFSFSLLPLPYTPLDQNLKKTFKNT